MDEQRPGPGWVKNRRGNWEPAAQAALSMPKDEFDAWYSKQNPGWQEKVYSDFESNYGGDPKAHDYSLAYAAARQMHGLSHEEGVEVARIVAETGERGGSVMPESVYNRRMEVLPLSSPLNIPAMQGQAQAVKTMQQAATPAGQSGMRMAMKYGLPALGVLIGAYGLGGLMSRGGESEYREAGKT